MHNLLQYNQDIPHHSWTLEGVRLHRLGACKCMYFNPYFVPGWPLCVAPSMCEGGIMCLHLGIKGMLVNLSLHFTSSSECGRWFWITILLPIYSLKGRADFIIHYSDTKSFCELFLPFRHPRLTQSVWGKDLARKLPTKQMLQFRAGDMGTGWCLRTASLPQLLIPKHDGISRVYESVTSYSCACI
jgi:hypothetical protein